MRDGGFGVKATAGFGLGVLGGKAIAKMVNVKDFTRALGYGVLAYLGTIQSFGSGSVSLLA